MFTLVISYHYFIDYLSRSHILKLCLHDEQDSYLKITQQTNLVMSIISESKEWGFFRSSAYVSSEKHDISLFQPPKNSKPTAEPTKQYLYC